MMKCADATIALGAYVLDTLDEHERAEVDAHLRGCAECRAELAELATLPALLERLSLQDLGEAIPVVVAPEDLFAKVAAQARAEDGAATESAVVVPLHRRRRVQLMSAAAAVALIAGVTTAVTLAGSQSATSPQQFSAARGSVHMLVALTSQTSGTALRVTVSGLPQDEHCRLVAVGDDGSRDMVGRWWATYTGQAQVTGSTTISASHLSKLELFGTDGKQLVTVPV